MWFRSLVQAVLLFAVLIAMSACTDIVETHLPSSETASATRTTVYIVPTPEPTSSPTATPTLVSTATYTPTPELVKEVSVGFAGRLCYDSDESFSCDASEGTSLQIHLTVRLGDDVEDADIASDAEGKWESERFILSSSYPAVLAWDITVDTQGDWCGYSISPPRDLSADILFITISMAGCIYPTPSG